MAAGAMDMLTQCIQQDQLGMTGHQGSWASGFSMDTQMHCCQFNQSSEKAEAGVSCLAGTRLFCPFQQQLNSSDPTAIHQKNMSYARQDAWVHEVSCKVLQVFTMIFSFFTLVILVLFNLNVSKKFVDRPVSQTSAREHASPPGTPPPG